MHFLVFEQPLKGNESSDCSLLAGPSVGANKCDPTLQKAPESMVKSIGSRARPPGEKSQLYPPLTVVPLGKLLNLSSFNFKIGIRIPTS